MQDTSVTRETPSVDADAVIANLKDDEDKAIVAAIAAGYAHADQIVEKTQLPAPTVMSHLTMLELDGIVRQKSGKFFELVG